MYKVKRIILFVAVGIAANLMGQQADQVGAASGFGARYATDAYPGFDADKDAFEPSRKEPKWFAFINGPEKGNAQDQFAYCKELEIGENWSKAVKHYDALVREWPSAPEAPAAQLRLAELLFEKENSLDDALEEYRYLLDFYSFSCDYEAVASRMYEVAKQMEKEGKDILFFHFRNTVDVRRAFESCVLHAPGATWSPRAMLTIGKLREDEGKFSEAVAVYENLRNLHYGSEEAKLGTVREALARGHILKDHSYNRSRCLDTADFLNMALTIVPEKYIPIIKHQLDETNELLENEAYKTAQFYDSRMRTKRSAIAAYERFLEEYPESKYVESVRSRLAEIKGSE